MKRILCIGELLIDFMGTEKNKPISEQNTFEMKAGGAPANVAATSSALGNSCLFFGAVGQDGFGVFLENTLKRFCVDTTYLMKSTLPTTLAFVSIEASGERDFIFNRGADADLQMDQIHPQTVDHVDIFHFGGATGFLEGDLKETYKALLDQAVKNNALVSFDPNYRSAFWGKDQDRFKHLVEPFMKQADFVKLSDEEALLVTGKSELTEAVKLLKSNYEATFAITLGAKGVHLFNSSFDETISAPKVAVVDTTGAGDAFVGAMLYQMSQHTDPKKCVCDRESMMAFATFANQTAASVCTRMGALTALEVLLDKNV